MPKLYKYEEEDYLAHFPTQVSQSIVDYATDVAFNWSRYIFTWRQGKQQYGHCTHCKKEFKTYGLRHNDVRTCPECKSLCGVRSSGIGRKYMIDEVYFVYYEKSIINPQAITARGIYAVRDYRFDYRATETLFENKALYVFEPGNSKMLHRYLYFSHQYGMCRTGQLQQSKTVYSMFNTSMKNTRTYYSHESIEEAVKDTPFRYSTWERYADGDMVRFFDLFSHYPCIEYLTKLGLRGLVEAKLEGDHTYSAINWRGKTPLQVLRLSKQDFNEIKASQISIGPLALRLFQISKKDKSNLSFKQIYEIMQQYGSYFKDLQKVLKYTTIGKVHTYITKQYTRKGAKKHYVAAYQVLHTWRDYIADGIQLEMDLSQDSILFPGDLHKAHQDTIEKVKSKTDETLNIEIGKRLKSLKKYCFEAFGFILRPAADTVELIREGNALNHCVGRYAKQYAKGETNILVLRKASKLDEPFYTMEIREDKIVQTRGFKNCLPTDEIAAFIETFKGEKLAKKPKKSKVKAKIAVPA